MRSLTSSIAFAALLGVELLIIGWLSSGRPWSWLLLLTLPLGIWFLLRDQRNLQSIAVIFLDELAKELGLTKVHPADASKAVGDEPKP